MFTFCFKYYFSDNVVVFTMYKNAGSAISGSIYENLNFNTSSDRWRDARWNSNSSKFDAEGL